MRKHLALALRQVADRLDSLQLSQPIVIHVNNRTIAEEIVRHAMRRQSS